MLSRRPPSGLLSCLNHNHHHHHPATTTTRSAQGYAPSTKGGLTTDVPTCELRNVQDKPTGLSDKQIAAISDAACCAGAGAAAGTAQQQLLPALEVHQKEWGGRGAAVNSKRICSLPLS